MSTNYSVYGILVFFVIVQAAHTYSVYFAANFDLSIWDNSNPRGVDNVEATRRRIGKENSKKYERIRGAHTNGLESLPIFGLAVLAGNIAQLPVAELNLFSGALCGLRALFTLLYINTADQTKSQARSAVWLVSVLWCGYTLVRAAIALA